MGFCSLYQKTYTNTCTIIETAHFVQKSKRYYFCKLLAYDNTKCGVCTEPFPLPRIDPIVNITIEQPAPRKLHWIWFLFPILSRPHPFIYMEKCMNIDIVLDVIRNMIGIYLVSNLISLVLTTDLTNGSIWMYGFILYLTLCMIVRQTFAFK